MIPSTNPIFIVHKKLVDNVIFICLQTDLKFFKVHPENELKVFQLVQFVPYDVLLVSESILIMLHTVGQLPLYSTT